jgi:hypothetical protein
VSDELTIVIDMPDGPVYRTIRAALPLVAGADPGPASEAATRFAAARWGMPDFVFDPVVESSGSGIREIGDGVIATGRAAIMMQSKRRLMTGVSSPGRERNWLDKNIERGFRQGMGSVRFLSTTPTRMRNKRGRSAVLNGREFEWINLVIVDHSEVPDGYTFDRLAPNAVVLTRRDWEFLFDQLRSTHYVVDYLRRIIGESYELDRESVRYFELAQADLAAEPKTLPEWMEPEAHTVSVPRAPLQHPDAAETRAHLMLRVIMEDIAASRLPEGKDALDMAAVLAHLDNIPLLSRTDLGNRILEGLESVLAYEGDGILRTNRIYLPTSLDEWSGPLVFMMTSVLNEYSRTMLRARTELLHIDFQRQSGAEVMTSGVLLTPGTTSGRPWDTTMISVRGDLGISEEEIAQMRAALEN